MANMGSSTPANVPQSKSELKILHFKAWFKKLLESAERQGVDLGRDVVLTEAEERRIHY